jgi:hypothetical protein
MQPWHAPTEYLPVDNRLAREAIEAAYRAAGLNQGLPFGPFAVASIPELQGVSAIDAADESKKVREQLRDSGLAYLIPGGRTMLPDIFGSIHPLLRPLLRLFEPRTTSQLVQHLARNLDWYLDPSSTPIIWRRLRGFFTSPILAFLLVFSLMVVLRLGNDPLALALFFLVAGLTMFGATWHLVNDAERYKDRINAYELYLYLRQAYSDPSASDSDLGQAIREDL